MIGNIHGAEVAWTLQEDLEALMKILSQMSFQKHSVNEQNPANQLMLTPIPVPYHSSLSGV